VTPEAKIQRQVRRIYVAVGAHVYVTSQPHRSHVTPGLPDLIVLHPRVGVWFHEVKTPTGKLRGGQQDFVEHCQQCRVHHVVGGVQDAYRFLWAQGVLAGGVTLGDQLHGVGA
jgi:hypothetical protein